MAMVIAGLSEQLCVVFGGLAREHVLAGAFLALAVGVRVPQRLTLWVCAVLWARVIARHRPTRFSIAVVERGHADRPLYWTVLSAVALLSGVAVALLPKTIALAVWFYGWLHAHFVWSLAPLGVLHVLLAFGLGLLPLSALGLALSCAHHMSCRFGRWDVRATGWHLVGASLGLTLYAVSVGSDIRPGVLLVASSMPVFLVALLAAGFFSKFRGDVPKTDTTATTLPMRSDRWPTLLRASIVAIGGGAAIGTATACELILPGHRLDTILSVSVVPLALVALGAGVLWGCSVQQPGTRTLHGFGECALACGGFVACAALSLAWQSSVGLVFAMIASGTMLFVLGFTIGYGRQLLMASVASRSSEGSRMTARLLICVALAIGVIVPVVRAIGLQFESLIVLAVVFAAIGERMMDRDALGTSRRVRVRSGTAIVSIALLAVIATRKYSPRQRVRAAYGASVLKTAAGASHDASYEINPD